MRPRLRVVSQWTPALALACFLFVATSAGAASEAFEVSKQPPAAPPTAGRAALIGGSITFGVGYLPAVAIGIESLRYGYGPGALMFIPVAGPFITALHEGPRNAHPLLIAALLIDGAIQTTGATFAIVGWRQRAAGTSSSSEPEAAKPPAVTWALGGGPPGTAVGLSVTLVHR